MLDRVIERLMRAVTLSLAFAFILAVLLNFANVMGRYVFAQAILGADEIQVFVMVWMTFLGAVVVTWREQHLRMDVLFGFLPAPLKKAVRLLEALLLVTLAGFALVQSVRFAALMVSVDRTSEAAGIPMVIPHAALVVGFALIMLLGTVRLAAMLRGKPRPATLEVEERLLK